MKRIASFLAAIALCSPAFAADLAINKALAPAAVAAAPCTLQDCSGWTLGFGIMGQGSNLDILGSGISGSVFAGGGALGVSGGYQFWNGTFFFEPNVSVSYDISPNSPTGARPSDRFIFTEGLKVGTPLSNLFNLGAGPIQVPTQITSALMTPYVQVGAAQRPMQDMAAGWYMGAGASFLLAADRVGTRAWLLDIDYKRVNYGGSPAVSPGAVMKSENWVGLTIKRKF